MGTFLSLSGVVGAEKESVIAALEDFADRPRGSIVESPDLTPDDDGCLIASTGPGGVAVMYPGDFMKWDDCSATLSRTLGKPVFSFHIHDGDLWMYQLFENGTAVDQFNPLPDYWQEIDDEERKAWRGNAEEVARCVPGLNPEQIAAYLVPWDEELLGSAASKAYPTDEFGYGCDWQLVDFMHKLGFEFPDVGTSGGTTYRFP